MKIFNSITFVLFFCQNCKNLNPTPSQEYALELALGSQCSVEVYIVTLLINHLCSVFAKMLLSGIKTNNYIN